ncbi:MAG: aspartate--tRNA(Asn) ligase [Microbacteriaceae bacterium]|jgi:aspartyl-tRNA synthetase|nr:aspartate--tRNA(Asn) ligase [Microbacteriaceae bacterium]MCI1206870.1 aspartate--tRNA(Asn) ligase [Microbacteriaceae bacterium]
MINRTLVRDLQQHEDGPVTVGGWIDTVRDQKKVQFVILRDESGTVQAVNVRHGADDERANLISSLTTGSFVHLTGELQHNERVRLGGLEIQLETLTVDGLAAPDLPIAEDSGIDKRLDWRFLDIRRPEVSLVFRVQTTLLQAFRTYWVEHGFTEIQTPKLMPSPSESRAELFSLDYFDQGTAYLAQSPQLYKQMGMAAGLGSVFEVAPAFRADPSFTSRHSAEFTSVDAEMSWIDSEEDVMRMQEELLTAGLAAVKERHGDEIRELLGVEVTVPTTPFPRIPLQKAKEIVASRGHAVARKDDDMDPEGERQIGEYVKETYGHEFVFLTDYPASVRPYYHMRNTEDPTLTRSYDLVFNGTEITTGAQREHRLEVLTAQAVEKGLDPAGLGDYLDFFKYGMPPHGGFGMGLARVLMLLLHKPSIRETTYLFRGPTRLHP